MSNTLEQPQTKTRDDYSLELCEKTLCMCMMWSLGIRLPNVVNRVIIVTLYVCMGRSIHVVLVV